MLYVVYYGGISYVEANSKEEAIKEFYHNPKKIAQDTDIDEVSEVYKSEDLR